LVDRLISNVECVDLRFGGWKKNIFVSTHGARVVSCFVLFYACCLFPVLFSRFFVALCLFVCISRAGTYTPSLGAANPFAILAGTSVSSSGPTSIIGDVGSVLALSGFPPATIAGSNFTGSSFTQAARDAKTALRNDFLAFGCGVNNTIVTLSGVTLSPGVYCINGAASVSGNLTLNAQGNASSSWVFRISQGLSFTSNSRILLVNSAQACAVYWVVGTATSISANSHVVGNMLAGTSISVESGASSTGGLFANTVVNLTSCSVNASGACGIIVVPPPGTTPPSVTIPASSALLMPFLTVLGALVFAFV